MITETTYSPYDLKSGTCISCGEKSDEILIGDGRCINCIECELFYKMTRLAYYVGLCETWH